MSCAFHGLLTESCSYVHYKYFRFRSTVYLKLDKGANFRFKSSVILELEKDGSKSRKFTSDLRKNLKAADMHAAELAYRAIAENSTEIVEIGRGWDFRNWHDSRSYPAPCYETRVVKRHPKMSL